MSQSRSETGSGEVQRRAGGLASRGQGRGPLLQRSGDGGLPVGWLAYRAALSPALAYAELIKVAYDLYRHSLLKSLGMNVPATLDQEQKLWRSISDFIIQNLPPVEEWQFKSSE